MQVETAVEAVSGQEAASDLGLIASKLIGIQICIILLPSAFCLLPSQAIDSAI